MRLRCIEFLIFNPQYIVCWTPGRNLCMGWLCINQDRVYKHAFSNAGRRMGKTCRHCQVRSAYSSSVHLSSDSLTVDSTLDRRKRRIYQRGFLSLLRSVVAFISLKSHFVLNQSDRSFEIIIFSLSRCNWRIKEI